MSTSYQLQLQDVIYMLQRNADIFAQSAGELRTMATGLSGISQNLVSGADAWQGDGAKAFQAAWERHLSDSQHIAGYLDGITPILHSLTALLEAELAVANELERLDPISALRRLGLPVPHPVESIEQFVVDEAIDSILRNGAMDADATMAGELESIVFLDVAQQNQSQLQNISGDAQTILDDSVFVVEQLTKIVPALKNAGSIFDELDPYLQAVDVILQFASGKQHDLRTFGIDAGGGAIQLLIGLSPQGRIAEVVAGAIQIVSSGLAEIQELYASMFPGESGNELKDLADNLRMTADNADSTNVCDDIAKLIIDTHGTILLSPSNPEFFIESIGASYLNSTFGWHIPGATSPTTLLSDSGDLLGDSGKLVLSPLQLLENTNAVMSDDTMAAGNALIQNLPLPGSFKQHWQDATLSDIQTTNTIANFITRPDGLEHLGAVAWNWLTQ